VSESSSWHGTNGAIAEVHPLMRTLESEIRNLEIREPIPVIRTAGLRWDRGGPPCGPARRRRPAL
jgi:hypothetical protein